MDLSRNYKLCMSLAITAILIFISLNLMPPSTGGNFKASSMNDQQLRKKKLVLGSKPPTCVNKCMSCRPCQATLVIPPHMMSSTTTRSTIPLKPNYVISSHREDGSYYLLSWKCRCGNKLYQP